MLKLIDIAERSVQLAVMYMKSWSFTVNDKEAASVWLSKFFEGLIEALEMYQEERAASFANESRKLTRDILYKVLIKVANRNPNIDLSGPVLRDTISQKLTPRVVTSPRITVCWSTLP
jgi:hypothetical protein